LGRKTKFFVFLLFSFILFLNINIYLNLEYTYEIFEDYLFNVDKLFYIVSMHSILGSFFMTYAMYQRHRMISHQSREQKVFIRDLIYNIIISALFPFLYWLNNVDGIVNLYLISSLIAVIFYKPLLISFYKK